MGDVDVNAIDERANRLAVHLVYARYGLAAVVTVAALFGWTCHAYSTSEDSRRAAAWRGVAEECQRWTP